MCKFLIQKKALTFYSQSLICHCNALVLLRFIILPYKTSALLPELLRFGYSSFISQAIAPLSKTMTTAHVSVRPFPAVPGLRSWTPPASP